MREKAITKKEIKGVIIDELHSKKYDVVIPKGKEVEVIFVNRNEVAVFKNKGNLTGIMTDAKNIKLVETYEMCPECETEVKLKNEFKVQTCPECQKDILPCSICKLLEESPINCTEDNCPLEKTIHITGKIPKYDEINNLALRSDIENNNIYDTFLTPKGKISDKPEIWSIVLQTSDGMIVDTYLYKSKSEYKEDLSILRTIKK